MATPGIPTPRMSTTLPDAVKRTLTVSVAVLVTPFLVAEMVTGVSVATEAVVI